MSTSTSALPAANAQPFESLLSSEEVAKVLCVSHGHVKAMARERKIPMFKSGLRWRIRQSTFTQWIAEQEAAAIQKGS
ncbi:MAG: Helix-turn-helix domain [Acidobacteriales bacterium]|nr:Helix-turn-helix domain [Terriglobales bacterium]